MLNEIMKEGEGRPRLSDSRRGASALFKGMIKGRHGMAKEQLIDDSKVRQAAACLKTLAHEFRLKVMCSLVDGEKNVQQLMQITGASQSNLSQHLAKMRDKGLLDSRREANQIFYRIADLKMLEILKALHSIYCEG